MKLCIGDGGFSVGELGINMNFFSSVMGILDCIRDVDVLVGEKTIYLHTISYRLLQVPFIQ